MKIRCFLLAALCVAVACGSAVETDAVSVSVTTDDASGIGEDQACLRGSFGSSNAPLREVGFEWGETSAYGNRLQLSVPTSGKSFYTVLEGLEASTTYHFRAYAVIRDGADDKYFYGADKSFTTEEKTETVKASVEVTTLEAFDIGTTTASLAGSYADATTTVYDRGFYYGTTEDCSVLESLGSSSLSSGNILVQLSSLEPGTTYYYKAYVTIWNPEENKYVDFFGEVKQFSTETEVTGPAGLQYLGCYEMPAIDLKSYSAASDSGTETFGSTLWYKYYTNTATQAVITHTYEYNGAQYRNWTALIDGEKQGPLWSAFVMHSEAYPKTGIGRYDTWTEDPGIPSSWQRSVASSTHSRGHFVASAYRQTTSESNQQTFYYTNQALQYQNGFNSGIWSSLETAVVNNAPSGRDTLYVTVGVLYEDPENYQTANKTEEQVLAPSHFYTCLMLCGFDSAGEMTSAKGVAYLFENKPYSGSSYGTYATSIDAVEERSGWDFFTNVPSALQASAEAMTSGLW